MRSLALLFMVMVSFSTSLYAQTDTRGLKAKLQAQAGTRWAICIGINNYDDPNIVKLKKAANDAWLLSDVLSAQGEFKVYTFADVEKDGSLRPFNDNFFPTKIKIEQFLDNMGQYIKPEDLVVFSFSGHGVNDANANGYLLPLDCRLDNPLPTSVSEATITSWLKKLGVTRSLVLLDACRSELRNDRSIAGRDILYNPMFEKAKVSAVFYSSEKGAVSYEDPNSPNGAFTRFVASGLQGTGDRDNDGLVTFRELQTYVESSMMEWALGTGHSQRPYIRLLDEQSGDLALAIAIPGMAKRQDQPPVISQKLTGRVSDIADMRMVSIPGGTFSMGSEDREANEKPVHTVTLSSFEMSATEVTVGQFREFVRDTGYLTEAEINDGAYIRTGKDSKLEQRNDANWKNPYIKQGDDHPVVCVSWNDALFFCEWLSKKTGKKIRLPLEAEREYACRAGTMTTFNIGNDESDLDRAGWIQSNSGGTTHPVGQKIPNSWGLYDMHGNVNEWCQDWYGSYTSESQTNPIGALTSLKSPARVIRGGSYWSLPDRCRSFTRSAGPPIASFNYVGFRVIVQLGTDVSASNQDREKNVVAGITMVSIPSGSFQMGSPFGEADEKPVHMVRVSAFEMSATEVTVAQFREFVTETGYRTDAERNDGAYIFKVVSEKVENQKGANWNNPFLKQGDDHPVVCVSWNDAQSFCEWLSLKTKSWFRLPTEAEWEYSCRAGSTTLYNLGNTESDLARAGWYDSNSRSKMYPVGQKTPNAWGLYDMHGNVWEWCSDWKADYKDISVTNPRGGDSGSGRVIRGGCWVSPATGCRPSRRNTGNQNDPANYIGFRVVRNP